jgi:gliding motility-associated-like protein
MRTVRILGLILLLSSISMKTEAQITCPPNIDFELGTLSNWNFGTGLFTSIASLTTGVTTGPAIACRHTLTRATGLIGCAGGATDPIGGFPVLAPGSGSYSFRLGNNSTGRQIDRATYYVNVPAGFSNFSMIYRYATVLQDPSHSAAQQPRFVVRAFDSATLSPVPCANYNYVATASMPGFISVGSVRYLPWSTGALDLSGMGGTTVAIEFTTADCSLGGHYGYAYIDLQCGLFQIMTTSCDTLTPPTLSAPPGFQTYTWYDSSTFSTLYGSTQNITIATPTSPITLAVILTPYPGFGCTDTLYTRVIPAHMALNPSSDTAICVGSGVMLNPNATDIALPLTYSWAPAAGLSCTTCATPIASPTTTTAYTVTVTNTSGCTQSHVFNVSIISHVVTTVTIDTPSCNGFSDGSASVTALTGTGPYTYLWTTTPVQTTSVATGLAAGTYSVMVMDTLGCTDTTIAVVPDPAPSTITVSYFTNPTTCLGNEGSIILTGSVLPDSTYTISYKVNGVPQVTTITANSSGQIILPGLIAATYSDITIIYTLCSYNSVGPVVLTDPLPPNLSVSTFSSNVCEGDAIMFFGSSTTMGITWLWSGPDGFTSTVAAPVIATASLVNAGTYTVTVSKNNCYTDTSIVIAVKPLPVPTAVSNSPVCAGDTLFLTVHSINGSTSYSWDGPNGFTSTIMNPRIANVQTTSTGTYTVDVTLNGCTVPATVDVLVNPTPGSITGNTRICQYDSSKLINASSGGAWTSSNATIASVNALGVVLGHQSGTATISYTMPSTCMTSTIVTVVPAPDANAYINPNICLGDTITLALSDRTSNAEKFLWLIDGLPILGNPVVDIITSNSHTGGPYVISWNDTGIHIITLQGATVEGCRALPTGDTVRVHALPDPRFKILPLPDRPLCIEDSVFFIADIQNYGYNYKWEPEHSFVNENRPEIWGRVEELRSMITLTVTTPFGCKASYSQLIKPEECCTVSFPNAFTPNGDDKNDYFRPIFTGYKRFQMFRVNNRWGQTVFESVNSNPKWDGTYNGVNQDLGVYYYYLRYDCGGKTMEVKGDVTLIR